VKMLMKKLVLFSMVLCGGCAMVSSQSAFIGRNRDELILRKGEPGEILKSDRFEILVFESTAAFVAPGYWRQDFDPYAHGYYTGGAYLMNAHGHVLKEYIQPRESIKVINEMFWIDSEGKVIKYKLDEAF